MWRRYPWQGRALALVVVAVLAVGGCALWIAALESRGHEAQQHLLAARAALSQNGVSGVLDDSAPPGTPMVDSSAVAQLTSACDEASQADAALQDISGQVQAVQPVIDALRLLPGVG